MIIRKKEVVDIVYREFEEEHERIIPSKKSTIPVNNVDILQGSLLRGRGLFCGFKRLEPPRCSGDSDTGIKSFRKRESPEPLILLG